MVSFWQALAHSYGKSRIVEALPSEVHTRAMNVELPGLSLKFWASAGCHATTVRVPSDPKPCHQDSSHEGTTILEFDEGFQQYPSSPKPVWPGQNMSSPYSCPRPTTTSFSKRGRMGRHGRSTIADTMIWEFEKLRYIPKNARIPNVNTHHIRVLEHARMHGTDLNPSEAPPSPHCFLNSFPLS